MEKKIATSIDLLINIDRFEHLQITKYGECKIEYSTEEERKLKEDQFTAETIDDMMRSLSIVSNAVQGKVIKPLETVKDKISNRMPTWLSEGNEPNIANLAIKNHQKAVASNEAQKQTVQKANSNSVNSSDLF